MTRTDLPRRAADSTPTSKKADGWTGWLKEAFYGFKQVESVYYTTDDDLIGVWVVIPERELSLLRRLIDVEMKFLDRFDAAKGPRHTFEFHIIYRCGVSETSLIPRGAIRLSKGQPT